MAPTQSERIIVFADICKSTQLFERYGNVRARNIISHALSILTNLITSSGGVVVKTIGDEVMATFSNPMAAINATSEMHPAIHADQSLADVGLAIKIGLHFGEVLLENDDVYGDTVNVAARMVGLAKADQIITTDATIKHLPPSLWSQTRSLGPMTVRGKKEAIEIVEYLWQPDTTNLTVMPGDRQPYKRVTLATLLLQYAERDIIISQDQPPFSIGRGEQNNLVVEKKEASRTHAHIEFRNGNFMLVDHSSNGTYIQVGSEEKIFVHRDHIRLRQTGFISLGMEWTPEDLIRYVCES